MSSANRGSCRNLNDFYQTPQWCINKMTARARRLSIYPDFIIDLGAGIDGRIGLAAQGDIGAGDLLAHTYLVDAHFPVEQIAGDMVDGVQEDALSFLDGWECRKDASIFLVSNPPFSQAFEFLQAAHRLSTEQKCMSAVAFLLRLNFLGSKKRAGWLKENPPTGLSVLSPRPSFTGGGTDSCEYAWFWWLSGAISSFIEVMPK